MKRSQSTVPLRKRATRDEYAMYNRYVEYFHSGRSPYGGVAPLPFDQWMALPPRYRPGGPAAPTARSSHLTWTASDIKWEK